LSVLGGSEHIFINAFADFLNALSNGVKITPDFDDGAKIIRALKAIELSNAEHRRVLIDEIQI